MSYDNLRHGTRRRLIEYKAKAATYAANPKYGEETRTAYAQPDAWKGLRWITPHGIGFAAPSATATRTPISERGPMAGCVHLDSGALDHLRGVKPCDTVEGVRIDHRGWYCDAHRLETIRGHVAQLPGRDGAELWVAFIAWSDACGITMEGTTYASERDAARAADSLAESVAERGREESERWHEANALQEAIEDAASEARGARLDFARTAKAWREQHAAGTVAPMVCAMLREKGEAARRDFLEAMETLRAKRDELETNYAGVL